MSTDEPFGPSPEQPTTPNPPTPPPPPPPPPDPGGWGAPAPPPPPPPEGWGAPPPPPPPPEGWGPPGQPPYGQPPYGQPPYGQPPYAPPPYGQQYGPPPQYGYGSGYGYGQQTEPLAVVALVLAIGSWVLCPIVPAIAAVVLAGRAELYIRASGGRTTGEGMAKAARIVSWINIGFWGFLTALLVILAFAGAFVAD